MTGGARFGRNLGLGLAGSAGAGAAPAGRSGSARRRVRAQGIAETARLRAEVKRLRGCLGVLPELDRHLIQMRAGIDGPALTRRAAAKELSISVTRAHRIERRGLRAMRSASRQGRCGTRPKASHAVPTFRLAAPARG